ncbi:MAG: hypothetical protein IPP42_01790 [Saprospiraceae bacterium]|nr:hypothetical protein [Saprospiraceae bacterium]
MSINPVGYRATLKFDQNPDLPARSASEDLDFHISINDFPSYIVYCTTGASGGMP